jgi:hypothetical protein
MNSFFPCSSALALLAVLSTGCVAVDEQRAKSQGPRFASTYKAEFLMAGGKYEHDIDGSFDDGTSAGMVSARFEGVQDCGIGGGIAIEYMSSNDYLFEGQAPTTAHAESFDISPYLLYVASAGDRFRMPVHFGPWVHVLTLDDQGSTESTRWMTYGLRFALEPEIVIEQGKDFEWTLFTSISFSGGATRIDLDTTAGNEDFDSHASAVGFEVGPRLRWAQFSAGVSYIRRGVFLADAGPRNGLAVNDVDTAFDGVALSFGFGF